MSGPEPDTGSPTFTTDARRSDRYGALRVVLIGTTHAGNIGASARAMKNMGLERLYLVNPTAAFPSAEATARASGADDVLARAVVCTGLGEALEGCGLVVGASARLRSLPWPTLSARDSAARVAQESRQTEIALVFGREHSGLTNEELECCHFLLHIAANPHYSSLNLAAAVQVVCYEVRVACEADAPGTPCGTTSDLADAAQLEHFYQHLERVLVQVRFLDPAQPRHLMRRLRRLFNRARPDRNEINILRGILTATEASGRRARPPEWE